jgi:hypothetical protein
MMEYQVEHDPDKGLILGNIKVEMTPREFRAVYDVLCEHLDRKHVDFTHTRSDYATLKQDCDDLLNAHLIWESVEEIKEHIDALDGHYIQKPAA